MKNFCDTLYRKEELLDEITKIFDEVANDKTNEIFIDAISLYESMINLISTSNIIRNKEYWIELINLHINKIKMLNFVK